MHVKKKFAIVYCTIMCVLLLAVGKLSCESFVHYMEWDGLFTVQRR
jgi:hypothetical protein